MVIVIEAAMAAASTLPTNALQPIRRSAKEDAYPTNGCQITNCDDDKTKTTGLLTCRFRCLNQRSLAPKFGCETLPDDYADDSDSSDHKPTKVSDCLQRASQPVSDCAVC